MNTWSRWAAAILLAGVATIPADVTVQTEDGAASAGKDWTVLGGDWGNSRHSSLSQINPQTVARLGASYLKIDMGLVRDVHEKPASQQVVKAILDLGEGVI